MSNTLGEAVDSTLDIVAERDAEAGQRFRREYGSLYGQHNTRWRGLPDTIRTGVFAGLLEDMRRFLESLPDEQQQ